MKKIKVIIKSILIMLLFIQNVSAQKVTFKEEKPFYPQLSPELLNTMKWGYLEVPENWTENQDKKIKIAVTILKSKTENQNKNAVVFIPGGPGSEEIKNLMTWSNHPLRQENDIILFDVRGTGFSKPRLCPNLGKEFLKILSKNQSEEEDEREKIKAALSCKLELINRDIDPEAYHSQAIVRDIHALKESLGYQNWNVYGISYGTYIAQIYANNYPQDIKTLVVDSSISDITQYYTKNTVNFMKSLKKVFEFCKNDKDCNRQFLDIEQRYYNVITSLRNDPLTVPVDKTVLASGKFTFNEEDFKIVIQQALYNKELIALIPTIITQFEDRNEGVLGNLVDAFSSLLSMDYGLYYSISCNEVLLYNDITKYKELSSKYKKLSGGVAFYKSDFGVCEQWQTKKMDSINKPYELTSLSEASYPVLIFSGAYDPITPQENAIELKKTFKRAKHVKTASYGHLPGFSPWGGKAIAQFVKNPEVEITSKSTSDNDRIQMITAITTNKGISKMGNSLYQIDPIFIAPLVIAIAIIIVFILIYSFKLIKKTYKTTSDIILRVLIMITSIVGIVFLVNSVLILLEVSKLNYYILAFGIPKAYEYLFSILFAFIGLLGITLLFYGFRIKKIQDRSIAFSVLFSNVLIIIYMIYWGVLSI